MSAGNCTNCGGDGWFQLGHWHGDWMERCGYCLGSGHLPEDWWRVILYKLGILKMYKEKGL